ncbi:hypothetical protein BDW60DRAFT_189445 [Aspergillus nidulans var. acristatus]
MTVYSASSVFPLEASFALGWRSPLFVRTPALLALAWIIFFYVLLGCQDGSLLGYRFIMVKDRPSPTPTVFRRVRCRHCRAPKDIYPWI